MTSEEKSAEDYLPLASSPPTTSFEYSPSISKDLRDFDDALTHAIDQLRKFNGETMSDLSLKYELMRNNEVRFNFIIINRISYSNDVDHCRVV